MNAFLTILVFLLPSQLAFHFWPPSAFVFGLRVDYLAPTIYFTDVLLLILLTEWFLKEYKIIYAFIKKHATFLFLIFLFVLINTIFSTSPAPTLYKWGRVLEASLFSLYIISKKKYLDLKLISNTIFYSITFFSTIGVLQFILGRTLGGPFYFLGERTFNTLTPGIALTSIRGEDFLRAYSTFPHPNSLAGFVVVAFLVLIGLGNVHFKKKSFLFLAVIMSAFLLTFSLSAFLAAILVFIFYLFSKNRSIFKTLSKTFLSFAILFSLLLPILSNKLETLNSSLGDSFSQRVDLSYVAGKMISEFFLIGTGLNAFIVNLPQFMGIHSYIWTLQPVHNIFLLAFAETGIVGLLLLSALIYKVLESGFKKRELFFVLATIFIVTTGLFDHYWITIQQNLLLFGLLVGLTLSTEKRSN